MSSCEFVDLEDLEILDSIVSNRLTCLAEAGATGELVCSCDRGEAHVYLQRGRVAWANDSRHVRAFTSHLKEHARLEAHTIEAVVVECRESRCPIGETLVQRKLATGAQVQAALRNQIMLALHIGECFGGGETVFLRRRYDEYDDHFTFDARDLLSDGGAKEQVHKAPQPVT
jgi:hypothetical protein